MAHRSLATDPTLASRRARLAESRVARVWPGWLPSSAGPGTADERPSRGSSKELETIVGSLQSQKYDKVILNFQGVKFMNSTTMGQIAKLIQDAKNKKAVIASTGEIDPFVYQLFSISGLDGFLTNPET